MQSAAYIETHGTSNSISKLSLDRERKKKELTNITCNYGGKKERNSVKFYIPEKETVAKKKKKESLF